MYSIVLQRFLEACKTGDLVAVKACLEDGANIEFTDEEVCGLSVFAVH